MTTPNNGHTGESDSALLAHKTWRTVEPVHGMIYFVSEAAEEYAKLGVTGQDGYFASRAAPLGAVSAEVVIATFFNFNPVLVHRAIPGTWQAAMPADLLAARFRAADRALRRLLGDGVVASPEMARAAELIRIAAEVCSGSIEGRPLCAAHTNVAWPEEPHLVLWHAQSILREYRGDGHIASLVVHGLSGIEALVTHAGEGALPASLLQSTRGWSDKEWSDAVDSLRARGWLTNATPFALSEWGAVQRAEIEAQTDALAIDPYAELGESACSELRALVRPWSRILSEEILARAVAPGS
jgi:hypothetical protein